jgi:hypothetical protein
LRGFIYEYNLDDGNEWRRWEYVVLSSYLFS